MPGQSVLPRPAGTYSLMSLASKRIACDLCQWLSFSSYCISDAIPTATDATATAWSSAATIAASRAEHCTHGSLEYKTVSLIFSWWCSSSLPSVLWRWLRYRSRLLKHNHLIDLYDHTSSLGRQPYNRLGELHRLTYDVLHVEHQAIDDVCVSLSSSGGVAHGLACITIDAEPPFALLVLGAQQRDGIECWQATVLSEGMRYRIHGLCPREGNLAVCLRACVRECVQTRSTRCPPRACSKTRTVLQRGASAVHVEPHARQGTNRHPHLLERYDRPSRCITAVFVSHPRRQPWLLRKWPQSCPERQ